MKKEVSEAAWKSAFGAVPYIGSLLNEIVFDYRSRVKQNRLNEFVALLRDEFSKYNQEVIDFKKMESEEFGDLFESILKRVIQTSSKDKLERFKKVLVDHMTVERVTDYTETFLDLVARLSEVQISILSRHSKLKKAGIRELFREKEKLEAEPLKLKVKDENALRAAGINDSGDSHYQMSQIKFRITDIQAKINENNRSRKHTTYNITEGEYVFLVQDLYSKGLLMDSVGSFDVKPFEYMYITEFGEKFLHFINE
jgi:hypothetical protein